MTKLESNIPILTIDEFNRTEAAVRVKSAVLDDQLVIASDNWRQAANEMACDVPIYRISEIKILLEDQAMTGDGLKLLHQAKMAFNAKITRRADG